MDIDIAWLLQCLDRFMAGGSYINDFYETNPPLSFIIYLPAYPFYTFLGLDAKFCVFLLFILYIVIANYTTLKLLRLNDYSKHDCMIVISACIFAQSWVSALSYGLKDHLIVIFLIPLCLYQYTTIHKANIPKHIALLSIIMGGVAVCLKPYYAILPGLLFLYRMKKNALMSTVTSMGFIGLAVIGSVYLAFIYIYTPEFIDLLPEIISVYSVEQPYPLSFRLHYVMYAIAGFVFAHILFKNEDQQNLKNIVLFFTILSIICLIPFALQNKGFHYHALPTLAFGMISLFIGIYGITKKLLDDSDFAIWAVLLAMSIMSFTYTTGGKNANMSRGQYIAHPLTDTIEELAWNNVYATYDFKNMLTPLPYLTNLQNGSRYGQVWTLGGLLEKINLTQDEEERVAIKDEMNKYITVMADDLSRYKPSVITIPQYMDKAVGKHTKNYYNFLIKNDAFKEKMQNYEYNDTIKFDYTLTLNNTNEEKIVPHDIYVLKRDHNL